MDNVGAGVLARIEAIRQEAMYALRLLAWGDFSREEIEEFDKKMQGMAEAQNMGDYVKAAMAEGALESANGGINDKWVSDTEAEDSHSTTVDH